MTERIRGRALQRIRYRVLSANPICVDCKEELAVEVDHEIALVNGGDDDRYDDSNRRGRCLACHKIKTAKDLGHKPRYGCDSNGLPLDPMHPWNKTERGDDEH